MKLSAEQLQMIEECGYRQFSEAQTLLITEISPEEYESDPAGHRVWMRGNLRAKFVVREAIIRQAAEGVPAMAKYFADIQQPLPDEGETTPEASAVDNWMG